MKPWIKVLIITLVFGIVSFLLGPVLWPMAEGGPQPVGAQLPLLIGVSIIESIAFGIGIAFLLLGWPLVRKVAHGSKLAAWSLYIGAAWYMISWWPHDRFHMSMEHGDYWMLIKLEYGFHVTLIIAGALIAYAFFDIMKWYDSHCKVSA
jgi:hypothetical protein